MAIRRHPPSSPKDSPPIPNRAQSSTMMVRCYGQGSKLSMQHSTASTLCSDLVLLDKVCDAGIGRYPYKGEGRAEGYLTFLRAGSHVEAVVNAAGLCQRGIGISLRHHGSNRQMGEEEVGSNAAVL